MQDLERIYARRFNDHISYRNRVWRVLVRQYLSRYIRAGDTILDLGCGYGEFINHIAAGKKYAMDMNGAARGYLGGDITFFEQDCSQPWPLPPASLDVVFSSNFFEHLPSKEALARTVGQAFQCLRPGGRIIVMGPNIRFLGGAYWDFWDHHLPLSDISMTEALEIRGFHAERVIARFLPYTMVNRRPAPALLIALYLKLPALWRLAGKQFLVTAVKPA